MAASAAACETPQACFDFTAVSILAGESLELQIEVTADELAGATRTATVSFDNNEVDIGAAGDATFTYETNLEFWQLGSGIFERSSDVGGADSTSFAVESSNSLDGQCDLIRSPPFVIAADTTLSAWTNFAIEGGNWDRANFAVVQSDGTRTVVDPDSGRLYNTSGNPDFSACTSGESGFGDVMPTWASSAWTAGALGSAGLAGEVVQVEVRFGTDGAENDRGFAFDQVGLTNVQLYVEDAQPNCAFSDNIFADGFESGDAGDWSASNATP